MSITFPQPVALTGERAAERMDKVAQSALGISGTDFLDAWDAGAYRSTDTAEIAELSTLIPFVR